MAETPSSSAFESRKRGLEGTWSEENDVLPLKQRMKILHAQNRLAQSLPEVKPGSSEGGFLEKDLNDFESSCPATFAGNEKIGNLSSQRGESKDEVIEAPQMKNVTFTQEKVNGTGTGSWGEPLLSNNSVSSKLNCSDENPSSFSGNCMVSSPGVDLTAVKVKSECPVDMLDELDLVSLKERQRTLLVSQKMGLRSSPAEKTKKIVKEKDQLMSKEFPVARDQPTGVQNLNSSLTLPQGRSYLSLEHLGQKNGPSDTRKMLIIKEKNMTGSIKEKFSGSDQNIKYGFASNIDLLHPVIKTEPLDGDVETVDKVLIARMVALKYEQGSADISCGDDLDHILLSERSKLFSEKGRLPIFEIKGTEGASKVAPSYVDSQTTVQEAVKGTGSGRPRKRRKTATDSVETALEEDAPGLLQVLIDKGVSTDEIKLYGQMESDEDLEETSNDGNFTEFESVMAKIFSERSSLLKLAPLQLKRFEKPSYCLTCLFSLVEQAHYLRFRKWPVEWGWSRELQSFIFVFKRHNRIVLERPEYGYATYFFELVDSLSIDWQIKRLVIAMKLTSYSRVTLIENKALKVGEDLTEGEAKVLMEYGWIPNTGFGTMLNYCDRVVHDRRNEKDVSEWRSKIGKLLVDGYNGGCIVSTDLPTKALQQQQQLNFAHSPEIKLEAEIKLEVESS